MKLYNLFHSIWLAFFSPSFYRQVGKQWRGRSFIYILLVLAVVWLFVSYFQTRQLCKMTTQYSALFTSQMPVIHFESGVASTGILTPLYIKWPNGESFIVIDTKDQIKDFSSVQGTILLHSQEYQIKLGKNINHYSYINITKNIGPKDWEKLVQGVKQEILLVVFFAVFLLGLILSYAAWALFSLAWGLLGWIISAIFRRSLSYWGAYSISLVTLTPAILLWMILNILRVQIPYQWVIYTVILSVYLVYAVLIQPHRSMDKGTIT